MTVAQIDVKPQRTGSILTPEQIDRAVAVMHEYLAAPKFDGMTPQQRQVGRDGKRVHMIDTELRPLLTAYLDRGVSLDQFKSKNDGINKRHEYWGFKGVKGQMFFNLLVNAAEDLAECDQELKSAITMPTTEDMARSRIRNFSSYVRRVGQTFVEGGGSKHASPKPSSIPFFLSYFWQIQDRRTWVVFYTSSVNTMTDLNLWQPTEDLAEDYVTYKRIHEELAIVFTKESGQLFGLYDVEHVFWFKGGNPYGGAKPIPIVKPVVELPVIDEIRIDSTPTSLALLPDSYVPPIVAIVSRMSRNEPALIDLAKTSGTSIERAFEKSIDAAFRILGYETRLMGQGQGRVPDGLAIAFDHSYAIIWDAKVRGEGYSMGTDDRVIREYIMTQSRELKRKRTLRNVYYAIVSSEFADDFDDAIRMLKMETDVNEVCLIEADALVAIVEAKLRDPLQLSLGSDGIQRLFSDSGLMTAEMVREMLSI